jgi:hypothetical protein
VRAGERPKSNGGEGAGAADWQYLIANIQEGRELHDSLMSLSAKMVKSGMDRGAVVNALRAMMEASSAPHDERWRERFADIPRLVDGAEKFREEPQRVEAKPTPITQVLKTFKNWLLLKNSTPVLAALGAVSGNLLDGIPIWLGEIGPPSSAKTEILNSFSQLPDVVQVSTLTCASLLSGTPRRQRDKGSKGGLLKEIGERGLICVRDFSNILSMHAETRGEVLAMLRDVYDGAVTRHFGSDGGKSVSWQGKVGMLFAATPAIDSYYSVIGAMGDRFVMTRMAPVAKGQFSHALKHRGATTTEMRQELAQAVAGLFAQRRAEPQLLTREEEQRIERVIMLAVRLRGAVERDRRTRELDAVYGEEGTARLGLTLDQLLAGLDVLSVERKVALKVIESVALDSVPPLRLAAYRCVAKYGDLETGDVAIELGLPTASAKRALEDLAAYGLIECVHGQYSNSPFHWRKTDWMAALDGEPIGEEDEAEAEPPAPPRDQREG